MKYLILSDIHSNFIALDKILTKHPTISNLIITGDILGYGPFPKKTLEKLSDYQISAVLGNHDLALLDKISWNFFGTKYQSILHWTKKQIPPPLIDFLSSFPSPPHIMEKEQITISHGSLLKPATEYLLTKNDIRKNLPLLKTQICFFGHTHKPAVYEIEKNKIKKLPLPTEKELTFSPNKKYFLNPGSVGQPRNGNPKSSFFIFQSQEQKITHNYLSYPVEKVQKKMEELSFPPSLISRLSLGK